MYSALSKFSNKSQLEQDDDNSVAGVGYTSASKV